MADFYNQDDFLYEEDKMGMKVTSGIIKLIKDDDNLIGISIGGGAPNCPCLYVVQVFDNTPAARDGALESGDEILAVNGLSVKGKSKVEVAKLIQSVKKEVTIHYNKLHVDPKQGKSLDIIMKKAKHRIVENMSSTTADALGLSRAILCNDSLLKKLEELEGMEFVYRGIIDHVKNLLRSHLDLCHVYKAMGDTFSEIGVREPNSAASEAFSKFGETHRSIERQSIEMIRSLKPILNDLNTFLYKAVPDTKLTIRKYADVKFEYLSYCLKVKEMDDEEYTYQALGEELYRVESGNYEYRLILRCRQEARKKFARLRSDVMEKLELLDQKHVQDVVLQIQRIITTFAKLHSDCHQLVKNNFISPIQLDLSQSCTFNYTDKSINILQDEEDDVVEEQVDEEMPSLLKDLKIDDTIAPKYDNFGGGNDLLNLE